MTKMKYAHGFSEDKFAAAVQGKRIKRMNHVDNMPAELRALVHEYGLSIVQQFINCGVTKAGHIRHLVESTLDEFSPTRGATSSQGPTSRVARQMTADHQKRGGYEIS